MAMLTDAQTARWLRHRAAAPDAARKLRLAAEHEAAHAVAAHALGRHVERVAIYASPRPDGTTGETLFYARGEPRENAMIALAAEVWVHLFRWAEFPEGDHAAAAHDRRRAREAGLGLDLDRLARNVRDLLAAHQSLVLALADKLVAHRAVVDPFGAPTVGTTTAPGNRAGVTVDLTADHWTWGGDRSGRR